MINRETILIADDAEINRALLRNLFESTYNILEAENGEQALVLLREYSDTIAAVLLDLIMPEKNGYELLETMRAEERLCHVPVIVITAENSADSKVRVFELGASDVITKPFEPDVVKSRIKNIIELGRYRRSLETIVAEQSARVQESNAAVIDMLSSVIEHRNLESGQHIRRIRLFAKILLEDVAKNYQEYNLDERKIQLITDASSMHDIGKIAIPDSILNKPGRLTPEEFEIMKTHTLKGCEILTALDRLQDREYLLYAYNICRYHHERWDGSGYPDGLKGNSIPICAQVVAIADCYDALTTDRIYKKAIPQNNAYSMILNGECGVFSPRLLECFKNVRDAFKQLSQEYADGRPAEISSSEQPALPPIWDTADNTLEQSQIKYFTLLQYMDSTVMEVDLSSGIYHLVYLADQNFGMLRTGNNFEESIRAFADAAVHPDDRNQMLELLDEYLQDLFDKGLTRRNRRYRVLDRGTDTYFWCDASIMRISTESPHRRRALLLWHREKESPLMEQPTETCGNLVRQTDIMNQLMGGIQKCRSDKYLTLLQINFSLTDLTGYTKLEIAEQFQNHYMDMIYIADRKKVAAQFREQRRAGKVVEVEYRLVTKAGNIVWVSDRCMIAQENGEEVLYCILLDITKSRMAEEELRLSVERHNIIMNQTHDILFEWDIRSDELFFSSNWEEQYGYTPITQKVRSAIPKASHIHPDDMPAFVGLMDAMAAGVPYKEIEFRIAGAEGQYRWRRVRATAQFDADGKPFKAVGVMLDIDSQKQASAALENRVACDTLTGLYNKVSAQERVEKILSDSRPADLSAMMLLDIDDFKQINDRFGHLFGDAVLIEMSDKVAALFQGENIAARIGGDEFMVFMPNVGKESMAEQRAEELIESLRRLQETMGGMAFSCSIGLSFTKGKDFAFQELFNQADRALYRAKAAGKNRYMRYRDEMGKGLVGCLAESQPDRRTVIESNQIETWNLSHFITRAFDVLYDAPDFSQAVQSILELIGKTFSVSRVYVFENTGNRETCSNTYEWCNMGVSSQKERLQDVPYVMDGNDYRNNFSRNDIFYCQDVDKLSGWEHSLFEGQRIRSTLQCAIRRGGVFQGFVGIDTCDIRRMWMNEQVEALTFASKLIAVCLLKNYIKKQ